MNYFAFPRYLNSVIWTKQTVVQFQQRRVLHMRYHNCWKLDDCCCRRLLSTFCPVTVQHPNASPTIAPFVPTQFSASAVANSKSTASSSRSTSSRSAEYTKVWCLFNGNENSFVCQCNDGTWNHRKAQESYSNCLNQVASTSLTTTSSNAVFPTSVAYMRIRFGSDSPY